MSEDAVINLIVFGLALAVVGIVCVFNPEYRRGLWLVLKELFSVRPRP